VLGFAGLGILVIGLYLFSWRHGASRDMLTIWAAGFAGPGESYGHFLATRLSDMWQAAFQLIVIEPAVAALMAALFVAVIVWGSITGRFRQAIFRNCLIFYAALLAIFCLINALRIWPLGALRPNQFLYAHMLMLFFLVAAQISVPRLALQICAGCALLAFALEAHAYASKLNIPGIEKRLFNYSAPIEPSDWVVETFSYSGAIGKSIVAGCPAHKTTIISEGVMTMAVHYYIRFDAAHRKGAALLDSKCVDLTTIPEAYMDPQGATAALSKSLHPGTSAWFVYTHLDDSEVAILQKIAAQFGGIGQVRRRGNAGYFELAVRPSEPGIKASP
jgi:hypothetical protein